MYITSYRPHLGYYFRTVNSVPSKAQVRAAGGLIVLIGEQIGKNAVLASPKSAEIEIRLIISIYTFACKLHHIALIWVTTFALNQIEDLKSS